MKRILIAVLLFLLCGLSASAGQIQPPRGFAGKLWQGTLALYGTVGTTTHFLCTAEPIAKIKGGYRLLSAGHCVLEVPANIQFSVAEQIGGPRTPVTVVKAYLGQGTDKVDFSLFDLQTTKKYPVFAIGPDDALRVGDKVFNPHFALGLGKQLSRGVISSQILVPSGECTEDGCLGNFLVQEYGGPGASGSAVVSARTHRVIGLVVYQFNAQVGFAIEPISRFQEFLAGPDQYHTAERMATANDTPGIRIPEATFQLLFGPEHPFTLTVTGPSPRFVQNGYTFVVDTDGLELSDDYYYDVPVFIDENEDGAYRLTSTREGFSVDVVVVQAPEEK